MTGNCLLNNLGHIAKCEGFSFFFFFRTLPPIIREALKFPKGNRHRFIFTFFVKVFIYYRFIGHYGNFNWRLEGSSRKRKKGCRSLKALPIWKIQSCRRSCDAETPPSSASLFGREPEERTSGDLWDKKVKQSRDSSISGGKNSRLQCSLPNAPSAMWSCMFIWSFVYAFSCLMWLTKAPSHPHPPLPLSWALLPADSRNRLPLRSPTCLVTAGTEEREVATEELTTLFSHVTKRRKKKRGGKNRGTVVARFWIAISEHYTPRPPYSPWDLQHYPAVITDR